jgi:hypothetical protein
VDNSVASRWAPRAVLVVIGWVAAAAALAWCVFGALDAPGRLFFGVTAAVLGFAALYGTRARPRLEADRHGVRMRGLLRKTSHPWSRVDRVAVVRTRRMGREVPALEIDAADQLHIFGRLDLGEDPRDVADALDRLRRGERAEPPEPPEPPEPAEPPGAEPPGPRQ